MLPGMATPMLIRGGAGGTPTIWNAADQSGNITLSGGNLTASSNGSAGLVRATNFIVGKKYFEFTYGSNAVRGCVGISTTGVPTTRGVLGSNDSLSAGYLADNTAGTGRLEADNDNTFISVAVAGSGDVIGVAIDVPNRKIYWRRNATWLNSADPVAGTGGVDYITTNPIFPTFASGAGGGGANGTANFGASAFVRSSPTGYTALG